ncbi:Uu.00g042080.m01.CDS01 [Anthostomella pinea]|uniref:Uu.00g042080.m01.CDS01 n=1 Tax=Anthostomella pinea TaxID=933095 RepID=A0AAI8VBG4_9PEZI|nr:Uu.00g042080.m01.CDS01 [Anthostomella pinea]
MFEAMIKEILYLTLLLAVVSARPQGPYGGEGYGNNNDNNNNPYSSSNNPYNPSSNNDNGNFATNAPFDYERATYYRTCHGILAALSFALLFPIGSLIMRVYPSRHAWLLHAGTQLIAYMFYIPAAGLGLYLVSTIRIPSSRSSSTSNTSYTSILSQGGIAAAHPIMGILLLAALFLQPFLGWLHHRRYKTLRRRTAYSHAHLWLGRGAVTLGIVNGGLGLRLARANRRTVVAYSVIAGVMWTLWITFAVLGEVRRARAAREAKQNAEPDSELGLGEGSMRATAGSSGNESVPDGYGNSNGIGTGNGRARDEEQGPSPPYELEPGPLYRNPPPAPMVQHHQHPYVLQQHGDRGDPGDGWSPPAAACE